MDDGISKQKEQRIEEKITQLRENQESAAIQEIIDFDKTPADLKADMDRFVIGQEQGKKIMCTAIAFHYRRLGQALKKGMAASRGNIDIALRNTITPKANIMIIGPTGCGKTFTGETASNLVGVSFVHEDMTKFSEVPAEVCKKGFYIWLTARKTLFTSARKEYPCRPSTCCSLPGELLKISIPSLKNEWPARVSKAIGDTI